MISGKTVLLFWCALWFLEQAATQALLALNSGSVRRNRAGPPLELESEFDAETYRRSVDYTLEKLQFARAQSILSALTLLAAVMSGMLASLDQLVLRLGLSDRVSAICFFLALALIAGVIDLPFNLYRTFVIEKRYGFNRITLRLWVLDLLKTSILSAVITAPLIYAVLWFMESAGAYWWILAFVLITGFQLLLLYVYPAFIAPIFNSFKPLVEGRLKRMIEDLTYRLHFPVSGIFVMDGSRRSTHSNAYFAGFGRHKRIVLYDTLLSHLAENEMVAVLAHEIGHQKCRHLMKSLTLSSSVLLAGLYLAAKALGFEPLYSAFGFEETRPYTGLLVFGLLVSPLSFFLNPIFSSISRRFEYQADRFAAEVTGNAGSMQGALVKLNRENLSNLTPHPLYSFFYYSHPTLLERLRALR